ncbi:universal stress protein [Altericroceibacterium spongiae]|uniref:Universal stress protein n=1 Tax=Altericroceibacterium spongiae TaxID=2320269 RepID=A0A420EQQ7_9SPHN|nr:universal stress protein [Altericroceibacterium spongiae]RKF23026.1 universal stress protein [Altericroceibacterium spongiae]
MTETERSIIVATDLSARCDRAVDRAVMLGKQLQARIHVVHVTKPVTSVTEQDVRATLADPEEDVDVLLPVGAVPQTILRLANESSADAIITSVARFNSVEDFFLGTAVDHLVRRSTIPVLVAKQRPHRFYEKLLIATDLSPQSRKAFIKAAELFPAADLHLLHAIHMPFESWLRSEHDRAQVRADAQAKLEEFLQHPSIPEDIVKRATINLGEGSADEVVGKAIAEWRPDLIVLGTEGAGGVKRAMLGSTASSLLNWIPTDTLVVHNSMDDGDDEA